MNSEELFILIRDGLMDAWMPDGEAALAGELYGEARDAVLSPYERENPLGVPGPGDDAYEAYQAAATSQVSRDRHADMRLAGLWQALVRRVNGLPAGAVSPEAVQVRALRTRRIEASTLPTDSGALVLVDPALHDLAMLHLSLILSSCEIPYESIGGLPVPKPFLDLGTAVRAARAVHGHIRWTGDLGIPFGVALPRPLDNFEHALIEQIELFVLAHEYAHSYLGHHYRDDSGVRRDHFGPVPVDLLTADWAREVAADKFAAQVLFSDVEGRSSAEDETLIQLLAVRVALFVLDEASHARYFATIESHPDGSTRYNFILQSLFGLYGHPAVPVIEGVVAAYIRRFQEFGTEPFDPGAPLSRDLASSPRVFFPDSAIDAAQAIDGYEFWEQVFATPATVTLFQWGLRFLADHKLEGSDAWRDALQHESDAREHRVASGEGGNDKVVTMVAIGEAWFHEIHLARLPAQTFVAGTTFSDVLSELEPHFQDDELLLCQAVQVLRIYQQHPKEDGLYAVSISDDRSLTSAREWVRGIMEREPSP